MITIANANALNLPLPDRSVQCVITSPPYWGLRDYGIADQIGLERTPQEYVAKIVAVMREAWRVLKPDGVLWLNIGDSYASDTKWGGHSSGKNAYKNVENGLTGNRCRQTSGLKHKDLVGIPWRVAFALQDDGWYLRSDIIWHKPNPMPESVTDRPTKAHEYIFLMSKKERYYYDCEAIKETALTQGPQNSFARAANTCPSPVSPMQHRPDRENIEYSETRNKRSVWTVSTRPYTGAHFATFPPALVEPMILAGSRRGDLVMDPFAGSGTVGQVAVRHGRRCVMFDLNTKYIDLQFDRLNGVQMVLGE